MTPDDNDAYFARPEFQPRVRRINRRKRLEQIAADPAESFSARQDARRLLEVAATRPRDFDQRFTDLMAYRNEQ